MSIPKLSNHEDARAVADWLHAYGYGCATQEEQDEYQALAAEFAQENGIKPGGENECICEGSAPDSFGNRDHIVNPECPTCA